MASRKKQDEKNLKTLRELAAIAANKYCFDCNQRGPTYVNVTIGSFVCTKCSGLLRGLTPPHRVKSISMATFTQDEINLLESKGNDYCRKVWLGLFDGTPPTDSRDEQAIKDFMSEKYEKKRYYIEPTTVIKNGYHHNTKNINGIDKSAEPKNNINNNYKMSSSEPKPILNNKYNNIQINGNRKRPEVSGNFIQPQLKNINGGGDFVANFDTADIFSATNNNMTTNNINNTTTTQQGFANFDNNPVFNNGSTLTNGLPPSTTLLNLQNQTQINTSNVPSEDRYAALKDLDNALKSQSALDWSSGSNGSLYSSPTPTGSMYSSPSPQSSLFGSPSQGQFLNGFPAPQESNGISNPFNHNNTFNWTNGKMNGPNGTNGFNISNNYQNPFKVSEMNGFSQIMQPTGLQIGGDMPWTQNPFKVGAATMMGSNNPFL